MNQPGEDKIREGMFTALWREAELIINISNMNVQT